MSKSSSHVVLVLLAVYAQLAQAADDKLYVQFSAGAAFAPSFHQHRGTLCVPGNACFRDTYSEQYDPGYAASVAIGYRIAENFRIELEGMYQSNDNNQYTRSFIGFFVNTGPFTAKLDGERARMAFLLNGYYDFTNQTAFTPYITAGLGGYHMRLNSTYGSIENDLDFAWQAGAGVNYRLNDQVSFDVRYRYFGGANAELTQGFGNFTSTQFRDVGEHQVMAGIRIGF